MGDFTTRRCMWVPLEPRSTALTPNAPEAATRLSATMQMLTAKQARFSSRSACGLPTHGCEIWPHGRRASTPNILGRRKRKMRQTPYPGCARTCETRITRSLAPSCLHHHEGVWVCERRVTEGATLQTEFKQEN